MEIEKLERKHTESPEGRYFVPLANAYRKTGEVEHAEHLLREGLKYHPDYLSAHIVLGRCLADRHELDAAAAEFRHVLSVDAQNLVALRSLGEIATEAGQPDEAERWYRQLLDVDPMNDDARRALEEDTDTEAATRHNSDDSGPPQHYEMEEPMDLDEVLGLTGSGDETATPGDGDELVTETIADLYAKQGLHDRAASVYRELIRRNGPTPALQESLAAVERKAAAEAAGEQDVEPEPTWAASDEDSFADSFAAGFGSALDPSERTLSDDAPASGGVSIATFLSDLISWRPAEASPGGVDLADEEASDEFGTMIDFGDEFGATPGESVEEEEHEAEAEEEEELHYLPDEPLPWEDSPSTEEEAAPAAGEAEESMSPQTSEEPAIAPTPADEVSSEDDDLESFQAWLKSLKR